MKIETTHLASAAAIGAGATWFGGPVVGAGGFLVSILVLALFGKKKVAPAFLDPKAKQKVKLIEREELTHDVRRLRFALPTSEHKLGLPVGKHFNISAQINGETVVRAYTPVTSDDELGYVDLVIKVYFKNVHPKFPDGGLMSQYLDNLKIGDEIEVRGPNGHITYAGAGTFEIADPSRKKPTETRKCKKIGMIAGGTGITPMLQLIRAVNKNPEDKTELHLLFANQTENDIFLRDRLEEEAKVSGLKIWYTLDRPPAEWKYSTGFITEEMIRAHMPAPGPDTQIFMCGPPPMVKFACIANMEKIGYTPEMYATF